MTLHLQMWSKREADTSIRGLPFYVKKENFTKADIRQKVVYILSVMLVIIMLCVIFRFSAADATHSSHLSEGVCIRLVRELNSIFPQQFPKEKLVKVAEAIEYPVRKCAHFTEYAVLGITVNLYLWICYWIERLSDRKEKTTEQEVIAQKNIIPDSKNTEQRIVAQKPAMQEIEVDKQAVETVGRKIKLSIWNFVIRAEIFCALYACSDELHQYFVPGRSCKFFDVCVDSTGAFFGALLFWAIFHLWEQRRERKRQEISKKSKS